MENLSLLEKLLKTKWSMYWNIIWISKKILKVAKIRNEKETLEDCLPVELTADCFVHFKFAPLTSVHVERSFSL